MRVLRDLRRFILCKSAEGNHAEVRAYIIENLDALARALHVPTDTVMHAVESETDDGALCTRLLETLRRSEAILREARRDGRLRSAQASADALASVVVWQGDRALIDMPSLFASALSRRDDLLVFTCDEFTVAVYQAPLLDLSKIARVRADLSGWVDRDGVHLRWGRGRGGLDLLPQRDPEACKVIVALRAKTAAVAA